MTIQPSYGVTRSRSTLACAIIAAGMIVAMLVAQLFAYEDFPSVLSGIVPVNDERALSVIAACIVFTELFALPYLLGMYISVAMRTLSALFAFGVAGFWLFAALTNAHAGNSGLFSSALDVSGGLLTALWSLLLFGLICKVIFADSRFRHATS